MRFFLPALLLVALSADGVASQGVCAPDWLSTFGGLAAVDGVIRNSIVFDDASRPTLFVGGAFRTAGGIEALNVARFNGTSWSTAGDGLGTSALSNFDSVNTFEVFDDGSGPMLYIGGEFTTGNGPALSVGIERG